MGECILYGNGGGGGSMNFKVVGGTSEPSNPTENMIWVNTDEPITNWVFSVEQPGYTLDTSVYGITSDANKTLYTLSSRDYIKVNAGKAIYTLTGLTGNFWSPFLVSPDQDAVATTTSYAPSEIKAYQGTVEYEGVTYYYCHTNYPMEGTYSVTPKYANSIEAEALALLLAEQYHRLEKYEGAVWFRTGTHSPTAFSSLKKQNVMVYPISAKQYVSGALVDVTVKTYQNNTWVIWWNGELFVDGDTWDLITGGWVGDPSFVIESRSYLQPGTITEESLNLSISTSGRHTNITTANAIDLTEFSHLSFTVTNWGGSGTGVAFFYKKGATSATASVSINANKNYTLAVPAGGGEYRIGFGISTSGSTRGFRVTEARLTK